MQVCWNPEFLREGHGVADTLRPDRIVIGVASAWAEDQMRSVYARQLAKGVALYGTCLTQTPGGRLAGTTVPAEYLPRHQHSARLLSPTAPAERIALGAFGPLPIL